MNTPVKPGKGSAVNVGLLKPVRVDKVLTPGEFVTSYLIVLSFELFLGLRCTVKLLAPLPNSKKLNGVVVSPQLPRSETGIYWGYTVRIANSLSKVFSQCPYKEG